MRLVIMLYLIIQDTNGGGLSVTVKSIAGKDSYIC